MSDILSRLKSLGVTKGMPEKTHSNHTPEPSARMQALQAAFPNGIIAENDYGPAFINRLRQPLSQFHGTVDMRSELKNSALFNSVMEMEIPRKEDTLAFDTETSGLSNGSASFIFMLGLGYFEEDEYIVDQLILPDLADEPAFLRQAELIFSRFPILLSYNGRSFDIPMLQSRLRFHMFPDFTKTIAHTDLLLQARRYWKTNLGSVRLSNIEHYVLHLERGDEEVPGYMAPEQYLAYLSDGNAEHVADVSYHNQIDVVSLSAFLLYLNDLSLRGEKNTSVWTDAGASESALLRYNLSVFSGKVLSSLDSYSDREKKSMAVKLLKSGEREKAIDILRALSDSGDTEATEKLMKIYHKQKESVLFEQTKELLIRQIEADETLGKWSKIDKAEKVKKIILKQ